MANVKQNLTKDQMQARIDELEQENEDLCDQLDAIADIVSPDDNDSDDDSDDDGDDDCDDDGDDDQGN